MRVYVGKTLFAQVMEFVPWTSFARIVQRHGGNAGVRSLSCTEQFRAMAFAQLTWRESLRDIEASLSANSTKLYAMGSRSAVKRSTLADANESRDWRIWADLAAVLIRRARKLYASESLGVELDNTVYALDSSTVDLCLSLFDWAPFRSTKAAIKLHTLLDLCGAIPAFIHISDGKMGDVNVLDMLAFEAGAFYVMDRGYLDFTRLHRLHQAGAFFVTRAKRPAWELVAEGRLSLDDAVSRHVPEYPYAGHTVRQLVTHRNGLPDYGVFDDDFAPGQARGTADLLRATARRQPQPVFAPGVQVEYSNLGFDTAALVVERVTGQPIEAWWRERYFKPLGLQGIYARPARFADWPVPRTPGYQRKGSAWELFDAYDGEALHRCQQRARQRARLGSLGRWLRPWPRDGAIAPGCRPARTPCLRAAWTTHSRD